MNCLRNAGRLPARVYQKSTLYSTLSPCPMCSGAIILYKIPEVIVGENQNFVGAETYMRSNGIRVTVVDDSECIQMMKSFIETNPALWGEDITMTAALTNFLFAHSGITAWTNAAKTAAATASKISHLTKSGPLVAVLHFPTVRRSPCGSDIF
jgi:hypothetical protein